MDSFSNRKQTLEMESFPPPTLSPTLKESEGINLWVFCQNICTACQMGGSFLHFINTFILFTPESCLIRLERKPVSKLWRMCTKYGSLLCLNTYILIQKQNPPLQRWHETNQVDVVTLSRPNAGTCTTYTGNRIGCSAWAQYHRFSFTTADAAAPTPDYQMEKQEDPCLYS